ncbi:hypothetical protein [Actinoplanes sp. NPDC026619]|uniref:hypothetical protein n=1 Tax=Actinoplanes sp. NPDC026619 TaxID=3155798 RepID=UPI0033CFF7AE
MRTRLVSGAAVVVMTAVLNSAPASATSRPDTGPVDCATEAARSGQYTLCVDAYRVVVRSRVKMF